MKSLLIPVLLSFVLISCGSSEKKKVTADKPFKKMEKFTELEGITNDDFKPKKQIQYNEQADYHVISSVVNDVLKDESLGKLDNSEMGTVEEKIKGATGLCYLGEVERGLSQLGKVYEKYKKNPSYWNQVGSCYLNDRKIRKAKIFYNKAFVLNKEYVPAINNLGVIYIKEKKYRKAHAAFEQALKLKPNSKTVKYNLANLYLRYGLVTRAERLLGQLYALNKSDKDVVLSLANLSSLKGNPQQTINYLKGVDQNLLRRPAFGLSLYWAYKQMNNPAAAKIGGYLSSADLNPVERKAFELISRYKR
jgi:tetratricopeptide (TPR) repeat protein